MKMKQLRRYHYRRAAYDLRLKEFTAALEALAEKMLADDLAKAEARGDDGAAQGEPGQAQTAG